MSETTDGFGCLGHVEKIEGATIWLDKASSMGPEAFPPGARIVLSPWPDGSEPRFSGATGIIAARGDGYVVMSDPVRATWPTATHGDGIFLFLGHGESSRTVKVGDIVPCLQCDGLGYHGIIVGVPGLTRAVLCKGCDGMRTTKVEWP